MILSSNWKSEIIPGLYFISLESNLAVYGKVLNTHSEGYLWTICYHEMCAEGEISKLHNSEISIPLSAWQFRTARNMGWPSNQQELHQILTLPSD